MRKKDDDIMCHLNIRPYDQDDHTLPHGLPQLVWAMPVNVSELGAHLEVYLQILPQITTLRLSHRFRDCALSKLPQEILEHIINDIQKIERAKVRPLWHQDFVCFQGLCQDEDHFNVYGEHVELLWQEYFTEGTCTSDYWSMVKSCPKEEKVQQVHSMVMGSVNGTFELSLEMHYEAIFRWLDRTCLCATNSEGKEGKFVVLSNVSTMRHVLCSINSFMQLLKTHFGLEAIITHENLSDAMHDWLPNSGNDRERSYYTRCYLTPAFVRSNKGIINSGRQNSYTNALFRKFRDHTAFCQVVDPSRLLLSENERLRFPKAMRCLGLDPCYHLSELEPHVIHPIQDELLMDICSCHKLDCPASPVHDPMDKAYFVASYLENKSKGELKYIKKRGNS